LLCENSFHQPQHGESRAVRFRVDRHPGACYHVRLQLPRPEIVVSDLKSRFEQAAKDVMALADRPDNDTLLKLYALYKQGAEGDVSGPKPGFFDFVGTAKYEAWAKLKGTAQEEAMQKYVDLVAKLKG
jgi:acyl-CoA-binding protein